MSPKFLNICLLTLACASAFAAETALTDAIGPDVVRVRQGVVEDGVLVLRGVPFATPPVGSLRFRPPQPAAPLEGLRDALSNGSAAIQPNMTLTKFTDEYLGANFARRGVACVNISYRVGIFGFLELRELLGPDYRGSSANGFPYRRHQADTGRFAASSTSSTPTDRPDPISLNPPHRSAWWTEKFRKPLS